MAVTHVVEATGEEIAKYAQDHPRERFQLLQVGEPDLRDVRGPGSESWEELIELIHSMKGKSRSLPLEATSTEALYD